MPRPLTYRDVDPRAVAGAVTLDRMQDDVAQERRFQYQMERDRVNDLRYDQQDQRAQAREDRLSQAHDLDTEMQRWRFAKEKALNDNAALMRIDLDKQTIEGNQAMREISLDDPQAERKISEWGVKYFRLLDPEFGDKRLQKQYEINLKLLERRRIERERDDTLRQAEDLAKREGLKLDRITDGKPSYARPDAPKTTVSKVTGIDELTQRPFESTRTTTTGTAEQMRAAQPATPQSGKDFLNRLGIKPVPPKLKVVPNSGGAVEG